MPEQWLYLIVIPYTRTDALPIWRHAFLIMYGPSFMDCIASISKHLHLLETTIAGFDNSERLKNGSSIPMNCPIYLTWDSRLQEFVPHGEVAIVTLESMRTLSML